MRVPIWGRVTVVGCGLIGASFALALRRAGACARLAGWDACPAALDLALGRGVIDEADRSFADGSVSASDLIYLATPVGEIIRFLKERGRQVRPGAVLTDAGSTKLEVCRAARGHLPEGRPFVGGHPVAGSHLAGAENASADLFAGAPYVLTPEGPGGAGRALDALENTLELLGARVVRMSAPEHDRAMSLVSHLPQLVSAALASVVEDQPDAPALTSAAGAGYRDMTRLAGSPWSVWADILETNRGPIADGLDSVIAQLAGVRDELREARALAASRGLFAGRGGRGPRAGRGAAVTTDGKAL